MAKVNLSCTRTTETLTLLVRQRQTHVKRIDCVVGGQGHVPWAFWLSQLTMLDLSPSLGHLSFSVSPLSTLPWASTPSWYSPSPLASAQFPALPCHFWSLSSNFQWDSFCLGRSFTLLSQSSFVCVHGFFFFVYELSLNINVFKF